MSAYHQRPTRRVQAPWTYPPRPGSGARQKRRLARADELRRTVRSWLESMERARNLSPGAIARSRDLLHPAPTGLHQVIEAPLLQPDSMRLLRLLAGHDQLAQGLQPGLSVQVVMPGPFA